MTPRPWRVEFRGGAYLIMAGQRVIAQVVAHDETDKENAEFIASAPDELERKKMALARPCINCGYQSKIVRVTDEPYAAPGGGDARP